MAEHDHTSSPPAAQTPERSATREDFDEALSQAQLITDIIGQLADHSIGGSGKPCASLFAWLANELDARLERVEVADMTMRRA